MNSALWKARGNPGVSPPGGAASGQAGTRRPPVWEETALKDWVWGWLSASLEGCVLTSRDRLPRGTGKLLSEGRTDCRDQNVPAAWTSSGRVLPLLHSLQLFDPMKSCAFPGTMDEFSDI